MNVKAVYGTENRYYPFDSLQDALSSLGAEYTDVIPTQWHRDNADYTNFVLPRFPFKLYKVGYADEGWIFGPRAGALYGPNGKLIVNFNARKGGTSCQLWVGNQFPK